MLSWLSGDSAARMNPSTQHQAQNPDDPPETPAHVFAARAFKHAIFGTPAPPPTQRQARERPQPWGGRSKESRVKPQPVIVSGVTGHCSRPDSSDGQPRGNALESSPARRPGILLTPGTGGTRRKTVSFDGRNGQGSSHVAAVNLEQLNRGIDRADEEVAPDINAAFRPRARETSSFAEKLRGSTDDAIPTHSDYGDVTLDMNAPRSTSGRYWKTEFDSHTTKTATELRKLTKKEQVAKKYAQHRDVAAAELEDELQREQQKVAQLEAQIQDFRAKIAKAAAENASSRETRRREEAEVDGTVRANAKKISRLRAENQALRDELHILRHPKPQHKVDAARREACNEQVSDIWADVEDHQSTNTPYRRPRPARQPLADRDENVTTETAVKQQADRRECKLSDERREAALRRLEDRKKARVQASDLRVV